MYKIAAVNDEVDVCSICGKSGLKRVVWIYDTAKDETPADALPVGRDCAAILLGFGKRVRGSVAKKQINRTLLEFYVDQMRTFMDTPVDFSMESKPSRWVLREGQMDYIFRVDPDIMIRSLDPVEPVADFLRQYKNLYISKLNRSWLAETGLATGFQHQEDYPIELRNALPKPGKIS